MSVKDDFTVKFTNFYNKFKKNFYKYVFKTMDDEDDSNLTPLEVFTLEVIYLLKKPTVNELSKFLVTSKPNTAYKVSSLVNKGYLIKEQSQEDKREYFLVLTPKFDDYYKEKNQLAFESIRRLSEELDDDDLVAINDAIDKMDQLVFLES